MYLSNTKYSRSILKQSYPTLIILLIKSLKSIDNSKVVTNLPFCNSFISFWAFKNVERHRLNFINNFFVCKLIPSILDSLLIVLQFFSFKGVCCDIIWLYYKLNIFYLIQIWLIWRLFYGCPRAYIYC